MMNRLSRWVPLVGVVYTVLLVVLLFATPSTPDVNSSAAKVAAFYAHHRGGLKVQTYVLAYLAVAAVLFFGVLSTYMRRHGSDLTSRIMLAGAVVMAGGYGIAAGTNAMISEKVAVANPATVQTLNLINEDLPFIALLVGGLLAMIATGVAILQSNTLPTWMGWVAIVCGVANGIGTFISFIGLALGGLWIAVASVMLYQRMNAEGSAAISLPDGGSASIPMQGQAQVSESNARIIN